MKKCAVINDLSGFGKCSLTAALPIISVMGSEAHPLATAVLSNQTAYDSYDCISLTDKMPGFIEEWKKLNVHFDGILTGFVTDIKQLEIIERFTDTFKNDRCVLLVDPVMADNGRLYDGYTPDMCERITTLCHRADIITPNISELAFIAGEDYCEDFSSICKYAEKLIESGIKNIVVTGYKDGEKIHNLVFDKKGMHDCCGKLMGGYYSGTGDILAAVVMGGVLRGMSIADAVALATEYISKCISETKCENHNDGIEFERYLAELA